MRKAMLIFVFLTAVLCLCGETWTLRLFSSTSDWNAGRISLNVNGIVMIDTTLIAEETPDFHEFTVMDGDLITTVYTPGPEFQEDNEYRIFDHNDSLVVVQGAEGTIPQSITDPIVVVIPLPPLLGVEPSVWDFGRIVINTYSEKEFTLANLGGGTLEILSLEITGDYFVLMDNPAPAELSGEQTVQFTVRYAPVETGFHIGSVIITDGRAVTEIPLSGESYLPPELSYDPHNVDFGQHTLNVLSAFQTVTVSNAGGSVLQLSADDIFLAGPDASQFHFDASVLPASLGNGQSIDILISMLATSEGAKEAVLRIQYDGEDYDVILSGEGLPFGSVIIGNGTDNTPELPVNPGFSYGYTQSIFRQDEIQVYDHWIESVAYYWDGFGEAVFSSDWTIFMGHTELTEFTAPAEWIPLSGLTQVFCGEVLLPQEAGWVEVILDEPFIYNDTDNLVIAVTENSDGSDGTEAGRFLCTPSAVNRSISYFTDILPVDPENTPLDGVNPVFAFPNLKLQFGDIPPAVLTLSEYSHDFGIVLKDSLVCAVFELTNTGVRALDINNISIAGASFGLLSNPAPTVLERGETCSLQVSFQPLSEGMFSGAVTITDGREITNLSLTGEGFDPLVSAFPYSYAFDDTTYLLLGWHNARTAGEGEPGTWEWLVEGINPACLPYNEPGMMVYDCYGYPAGTAGELASAPLLLPLGDLYQLKLRMFRDDGVELMPDSLNVYIGTAPSALDAIMLGTVHRHYLQAPAEDAANQWYDYAFNLPILYDRAPHYIIFEGISNGGNAIYLDDLRIVEGPPAQVLSYAPAGLDFGMNTQHVVSQTLTITLSNTGLGILHLNPADITISGEAASMFTADLASLPAALMPGQSISIPVTFIAESEGVCIATLSLQYRGQEYLVQLQGQGYPSGTVVIGRGNLANLYLPVYPYYGYTYSQSIFLKDEINLAGHQIERVFYYWNGLGNAPRTNNWTVYMGHTVAAQFDSTTGWVPLSGLSQVFTGEVLLPAVAGWREIILDTPFVYNNTDNLVIAVDENEQGYDGELPNFLGSAYASNRSLRFYHDVVNPNPASPPAGELLQGIPNLKLILEIPVEERPDAVTLSSPSNEATELPIAGFDFVWIPSYITGIPTGYIFSLSTDEERLFGEDAYNADLTVTRHNPVTGGAVVYEYGQTYYWCVKAYNIFGVSEPSAVFPFTIQADPAVTQFPWLERFEYPAFPPDGWMRYNLDGSGTQWASSSLYNHSPFGAKSAVHAFSMNVPAQNGWLVTPAFRLPEDTFMVLSFWSFNFWPGYHVYNGVWVSTDSSDPRTGTWTELWSAGSVSQQWTETVLNITPYSGQRVYFGFRYAGYNGDDWYLDDVSILAVTGDEYPPSISYLPLLNTLRTDIAPTLTATIRDDNIWNSPIGEALLFYSVNGAEFIQQVMTPGTLNRYTATIPAQPLDTQVDYFIRAKDIYDNYAVSDTLTYFVENPVWLHFDSGEPTTYLGSDTDSLGVATLFRNPLYGTAYPLKLNAVTGTMLGACSARLRIYEFDGIQVTEDISPIAVDFPASEEAIFDLNPYNLFIDTAYFLVSYEGVAPGNYFALDETRPCGTSYWINQFGFIALENLNYPGSWLIGAFCEGFYTLDAPVLSIVQADTTVTLTWNPVYGARSYRIYSAINSAQPNPWTILATLPSLSSQYVYTGVQTFPHRVFKITSYTVVQPRSGRSAGHVFADSAGVTPHKAPRELLRPYRPLPLQRKSPLSHNRKE